VIKGTVSITMTSVPAGTEVVAFAIGGPGIEDTGPNLDFDRDGNDGWGMEFDTTFYPNNNYMIYGYAWTVDFSEGEAVMPAGTVSAEVTIENPAEQELNFTRSYPAVIKGNWEPNEQYMAQTLDDSDRLKDLGVNTVSIAAEYAFNNDGSYYMYDERQVMINLKRAKEKGFSVLLAPSFIGSHGVDFEANGIDMNLERFFQLSEEIALKWAEISEEYSVEYFVPQKEFNFIIGNYGETEEERANLTSFWHKNVLPKIKQVFTGKMVAALAHADEGTIVTGYDYVGNTMGFVGEPLSLFEQELPAILEILRDVAANSGAEWLITEGIVAYGGPFYPEYETDREGTVVDELQDDYYRLIFDQYLSYTDNKPVGFFFTAWLMPGIDVKDRPAEQDIKEFFEQI
jgi:hypothetical protein